jgi:hypothetical protein
MASWREMDQKPSFKIKKMEQAIQWGNASCLYCPPGEQTNVWKSTKVTLNNQVEGTGEIDAYRVFGNNGIAPLAQSTSVTLFRGEECMSTQTYAMVETINDDRFMNKFFGDNWTLYEVEYRYNATSGANENYIEAKREGEDGSIDLNETNAYKDYILHGLPFSAMNAKNIWNYFASERSTLHFDGACYHKSIKNNYFIAYNGVEYFFIPHGLDSTFQCHHRAVAHMSPECSPIKDCFANSSCASLFDTMEQKVKREAHRGYC